MNRLSTQDRAKIIGCLIEGSSVRATARLLDIDKKTVLRLLAEVGTVCKAFHDKNVRNVNTRRVQCDEIWSFCYAKEKNVPEDCKGVFGFGDVYTWTGLDADLELPRFGGRFSAWVTSGYPQAARRAPDTQPSARACG